MHFVCTLCEYMCFIVIIVGALFIVVFVVVVIIILLLQYFLLYFFFRFVLCNRKFINTLCISNSIVVHSAFGEYMCMRFFLLLRLYDAFFFLRMRFICMCIWSFCRCSIDLPSNKYSLWKWMVHGKNNAKWMGI